MFIRFLALLSLAGSVAWLIYEPGFEPFLAVLGAIGVAVTAFLVEKAKRTRGQQQEISAGSVGIQAGGDINIGNIQGGKNVE
jgi:hypothetical protein